MTWIVYALLSLLAFSTYEVISRVAGVNAKNPRVFSCLYNGLAAVFSLGLFMIEPMPVIRLSWLQLGLTAAGMIVWVVFTRLEYYAHKHTEASTMAVLLKLGPVVTFGLSAMVFGEAVTFIKVFGLAIILVASYLVLMVGGGKIRLDRGALLTLLVAICLGVAWTFDKGVSGWYGVALYTVLAYSIPALVNALTPWVTLTEWKNELKAVNWQLLVLSMLAALGFGSMMKALSLGEASRVIPVATSTTPLVVLAAAVFLGERDHLRTKIVATVLTVVGIVALAG